MAHLYFIQTVRHRDYFLPAERNNEESHATLPSNTTAIISVGFLLAALVAVVGLAKSLTPTLEIGLARLDLPNAVVGIVIAALVLLPEGLAALRAARANRLQTSLNLALGSALASIGLTIPAVAVGFDRAPPAARAGVGRRRIRFPAGADAARRRDYVGHRSDHRASRGRTFRHLCSVLFLRHRALKLRPRWWQKVRPDPGARAQTSLQVPIHLGLQVRPEAG